jgi:hypothetical protein
LKDEKIILEKTLREAGINRFFKLKYANLIINVVDDHQEVIHLVVQDIFTKKDQILKIW